MDKEIKEIYTLKEVNYLKEYYKDKIIGKVCKEQKAKVLRYDIDDYGKGRYDLKCTCSLLNSSSVLLEKSIKAVAESVGLKLPRQVLKDLDLKDNPR